MADQEGFIKIDRNILRWGWYKDIKTCHLFMHLLIRANYKDCVFMGCKIRRGQLAASYRTLAHESGLSYEEVRTALKHLISTGEAQSQRRSKYLVITIVNYDSYQSQPNQIPITSHSLPNHFPITSQQEKEYKNIKNVKKGKKGRSAPDSPSGIQRVERDEYGHLKLKPRDEGTADDIPTEYRDFCKTYQEFYDYMER